MWKPDPGRQTGGRGWHRGLVHLSSPHGVWPQPSPHEKGALAIWGGQQQTQCPSAHPGRAREGPRSPAPASAPVLTWDGGGIDRPLGEPRCPLSTLPYPCPQLRLSCPQVILATIPPTLKRPLLLPPPFWDHSFKSPSPYLILSSPEAEQMVHPDAFSSLGAPGGWLKGSEGGVGPRHGGRAILGSLRTESQ